MKILSLSLSALLIAIGATSAASARFQENAAPAQEASEKSAPQEETQEEADEPEAPKLQDEDVELYAGLNLEEAKAKVELLIAGFDEQMAEYRKKFQEANADEKLKLRSQAPKPTDFVDNLQKLAELHPATDVSLQALAWIVQRTRTGEAYDAALDTLVANHADAEILKPVILSLQFQIASPRNTEIFDRLLAQCMDPNQLGVVHYARLQYQRRVEDVKKALVDDPETAKRFNDEFGQERIDYINNFTVLSEEELLGAMEKLSAEYGDVRLSETKTIAQALEADMFEIRFLQVGKEAPDIEGEDIDGVAFKLSDYRGKVILLDFWGDW